MTRHLSRREFAALSATAVAGSLLPRQALARHPDAVGGPLAPPRLIVRGDDMGYSHSGNEAIMASSVRGVQSSIEISAPSPWFPEAARMLEALPAVDVGVHLALTSEWDNVKWRPLTAAPSLRDADGVVFLKRPELPWDANQVIAALGGRGRTAASVDELLENLLADARAGDHVVFMSNGGFENAPRRFLAGLG